MIFKLEANSSEQLEYAVEFFKMNSIEYIVLGTAIIFKSYEDQKNRILYITGCSEGIITDDDIMIVK